MQGQRGTVGSLPESFTFDYGSSSSNTTMDPQICWNNMSNQVEIGLPPDYMCPGDTNVTCMNPVDLERHNLNGWAIGGPSSGNIQQEASQCERKVQRGWSSTVDACAGTSQGPMLEERWFEPTGVLPLDNVNGSPVFMQSSNSQMIPQGLNLNETIADHGGDNFQVMGSHNLYKSSRPENERLPPADGSDPSFLHPAWGAFLVEDNDSRAGSSLERRRVSCKRKAVEANVGLSSASGSGGYFQHGESSVWHPVPQCNMASNSSISAPSEQLNPRPGLDVRRISSDSQPDWGIVGNPEGSQRNFRARIDPSNQQDTISFNSFLTSNAVRHRSRSSSHQSRPLPVNHSLDFRSDVVIDDTNPQNQTTAVQLPALLQNEQPMRCNGSSSSRTASSSYSSIPRDRGTVSREVAWPRNIPGHILEHPMFIPAPELRSLVQNPTNSNLTGRSTSGTGDVASTSRNGSSSGVHPSSAPSWVPDPDHNPPSRHPRRSSDVRQPFFSFTGYEPGGQSRDHSSLHSGLPLSSQDMAHPSGGVNPWYHHPYPRLSSWAERQGDSAPGFTHPLRALTAASEGRRRLASEIRNVLDLMRRGEGLRLEDVMILDRSVLLGVADIHDRHRDMRLDVDNMSYEELLALEERIGNVCTGLNEETIQSHLKHRKYSHVGVETEAANEPCCVCQEEYSNGDDVGTLECGHDFHTDCIKQWLMQKNICPICKTTGLAT